jgi:hypothetical protein
MNGGARNRWMRVLLACSVLAGAGCQKRSQGPPPPETVPVTGIVWETAGKPLERGLVYLEPVVGSPLIASGVVEAGRFTIRTSFENRTIPGAVPGQYRFVITPAFETIPKMVRIPKVYDIADDGLDASIELPANGHSPIDGR